MAKPNKTMRQSLPMKTRATDIFTATVHQILRAAKREGATAEVVTDSFIRALDNAFGPNPLSRPVAKISGRRTARARGKIKEDWSKLDHAAHAKFKLSRKELGLHNSFGEGL